MGGDLWHRFRYHPATTEERKSQHELIRSAARDLAAAIDELVPDGREKSTAITKVEEAMFWANAAVARN